MKTEMNAASQQREEMKRYPRAERNNSNLRKAAEMAGMVFRKVSKAVVLNLIWDFVRKIETRI